MPLALQPRGSRRVDDKKKAKIIAQMVDRRKAAIRQKLWDETALRLLSEHGTLSTDEVDRVVSETVDTISDETLADQIAAKTLAAVDYHRREVAAAEAATESARAKVEKFEELVRNTRADFDNLQAELAAIHERLSDAEELAEYAAQSGDATKAPVSTTSSVQADVATGKGGVN